MSTLAMSKKKSFTTALVYLLISLFCIVVDNVYAIFGHGVRSSAMSLMFLYPLLGGFSVHLLAGFLGLSARRHPLYRLGSNILASGIATLTLGGMLTGVVEIAGSSSSYISVLLVVGWIMAAVGLAALLASMIKRKVGDRVKQG